MVKKRWLQLHQASTTIPANSLGNIQRTSALRLIHNLNRLDWITAGNRKRRQPAQRLPLLLDLGNPLDNHAQQMF